MISIHDTIADSRLFVSSIVRRMWKHRSSLFMNKYGHMQFHHFLDKTGQVDFAYKDCRFSQLLISNNRI